MDNDCCTQCHAHFAMQPGDEDITGLCHSCAQLEVSRLRHHVKVLEAWKWQVNHLLSHVHTLIDEYLEFGKLPIPQPTVADTDIPIPSER